MQANKSQNTHLRQSRLVHCVIIANVFLFVALGLSFLSLSSSNDIMGQISMLGVKELSLRFSAGVGADLPAIQLGILNRQLTRGIVHSAIGGNRALR